MHSDIFVEVIVRGTFVRNAVRALAAVTVSTAAVLALPVVQSAAQALRDVATFDAAGVAEQPPNP